MKELTKFECSILAEGGINCVTEQYTVLGLMKWLYNHSYVIYHDEGDRDNKPHIYTTKDKMRVVKHDFNRLVASSFIKRYTLQTKAVATQSGKAKVMRNSRVLQILNKSIQDLAEYAFATSPSGDIFKFECKNKKYVIEGYIDHNGRSPLLNVAIVHVNTESGRGDTLWNGYRNKYDMALFEIKQYMTEKYKSNYWGKNVREVHTGTGYNAIMQF